MYKISFFLGVFTFLAELLIIRQMSIFLGNRPMPQAVIMFLFILGMGIGDYLSIIRFSNKKLLVFLNFFAFVIFGISSELIYVIPLNKIIFVYLISLFSIFPGVFVGYYYADLIKIVKGDKTIYFILYNIIGSLIGCVISLILFRIIGIKETFLVLSLLVIPFLFKSKILLFISIIIEIVFVYLICTQNLKINPLVYRQIIDENKKVSFPINFPKVNDSSVIFSKPSEFGQVIVDKNYHLFVHNEDLCWKGSNEERKMSVLANQLVDNPDEVLVIGLGCGMTLDEYVKRNINPKTKITVVEINPVVLVAEKLFFNKKNNPVDDLRVETVIADGFSYLNSTDKKYDLIIVDVSNPLSPESSRIYTKEFVELLNSRLKDNGKVAWWNFLTNSEYDRVTYSTIRSVFDNVLIKKMEYSFVTFSSQKPFFMEINKEEAKLMNEYEAKPLLINTINKPIIVK